jgi:hypothetical protein
MGTMPAMPCGCGGAMGMPGAVLGMPRSGCCCDAGRCGTTPTSGLDAAAATAHDKRPLLRQAHGDGAAHARGGAGDCDCPSCERFSHEIPLAVDFARRKRTLHHLSRWKRKK